MRIVFLRHANTEPGEDDKQRVISAKGRKQLARRRETLADYTFAKVLCSPTVRTRDTAIGVCYRGVDSDKFIDLDELYPDPKAYPIIAGAFDRLRYVNLATYLADSAATAEELLAYGHISWEALNEYCQELDDDNDLLVTGHAVCLPATVMATVMDYCDTQIHASSLATILHNVTGECGGFALTLDEDGMVTDLELIEDEVAVPA